jgi:hypothetical protein
VTHVLESSGKLQAVSEGSDSSKKAIQAMSNNDIAVQDVGGRRAFSLAFFVSSKRGGYYSLHDLLQCIVLGMLSIALMNMLLL